MFAWAQYTAYLLACGFTPGPNNIISLSNGGQYGFKRGLPFSFGLFCGQFIMLNLCIFACKWLNDALPRFTDFVRFLGGAYFLYLAWKCLRSSTDINERAAQPGFVDGFVLQALNPKVYLFAMVPAQTYILPVFSDRPLILLLFGTGMAFYSLLLSFIWMGFGRALRRLFQNHGRLINIILALLLVYCAVSLFL